MSMELQSAGLYNDTANFARLRHAARADAGDALPAVAREFEALFLQMMLKSMRDAGSGEGIFDSRESDFYREMHDAQLATTLSRAGGIGLAEQLAKQLDPNAIGQRLPDRQAFAAPLRHPGMLARPLEPRAPSAPSAAASEAVNEGALPARFNSPAEFVQALWPLAQAHAPQLGVEPRVLVAQAALETGWGRHVIRAPHAGTSSHNLFNIKADHRWDGARVAVSTLEYTDGVAARERASFRAYDSYAESFADYVDFVRDSARYAPALARAGEPEGYLRALQDGGYATDPHYARKVEAILHGPVLREALDASQAADARPQGGPATAATEQDGGNRV